MSEPIVVTVVTPDPPEPEPAPVVVVPEPEPDPAPVLESELLRTEMQEGFAHIDTVLQGLLGAIGILGEAVLPPEPEPEPEPEPVPAPEPEPEPSPQPKDTPPKSTHPLQKKLWK